jgi:hypothetical protein
LAPDSSLGRGSWDPKWDPSVVSPLVPDANRAFEDRIAAHPFVRRRERAAVEQIEAGGIMHAVRRASDDVQIEEVIGQDLQTIGLEPNVGDIDVAP